MEKSKPTVDSTEATQLRIRIAELESQLYNSKNTGGGGDDFTSYKERCMNAERNLDTANKEIQHLADVIA
jgi:hypothetical protein